MAKSEGRVRPSARALQRYFEMRAFQDSKDRPYIHLVDGGVADNIGIRSVLETLEGLGASAAGRSEVGFGGIRRVLVIVVNARSAPKTDWDRKETPPGLIAQLLQASSVPIDRYSFETVELMKDRAEIYSWRREIEYLRARVAGATEVEAEAGSLRQHRSSGEMRVRCRLLRASHLRMQQPAANAARRRGVLLMLGATLLLLLAIICSACPWQA